MIAFHFPPSFGSSGSQRTLKFCHYLREHDWEPLVLTVRPFAYRRTSCDQLHEVPDGMHVCRTLALDASQHLSVRGSYWRGLAIPDAWASWRFSAVPAGWRIIRQFRPVAIWSTYPIATAHVVAGKLHQMTGLPWVADFRDMMVEEGYPADQRIRKSFMRIERETVSKAERVVVTTPGTRQLYMERFGSEPEAKWQCIRNGYDEENFIEASSLVRQVDRGRVHLVHSGLLYPTERDPTCFYEALQRLKRRGVIDASKLQITLRSTGHDNHHRQLLQQFKISDIVSLEPGIGYVEALAEMLGASGLLLFQASNCNNQIPAKLYEYLRAGRPIFALTDRRGDTAKTLRECGMNCIVPIDDAGEIELGINGFLNQIRNGGAPCGSANVFRQYSRRAQAAELAALLDSVCGIS